MIFQEKSIYDRKKASKQWFMKVFGNSMHLGFQKGHGDHTFFIKSCDNDFWLVYVNDIIVASSSDIDASNLVKRFEEEFQAERIWSFEIFLRPKSS